MSQALGTVNVVQILLGVCIPTVGVQRRVEHRDTQQVELMSIRRPMDCLKSTKKFPGTLTLPKYLPQANTSWTQQINYLRCGYLIPLLHVSVAPARNSAACSSYTTRTLHGRRMEEPLNKKHQLLDGRQILRGIGKPRDQVGRLHAFEYFPLQCPIS